MAGINALLGIVVLAMGLVLSGQDGRMMTYAALVLALGSCQWLMSGGWRKGAESRRFCMVYCSTA